MPVSVGRSGRCGPDRQVPSLQNRLRIAEAAAARFGWPLEVIEDVRDDPCWERPDAAVAALRAALARPLRRHEPA